MPSGASTLVKRLATRKTAQAPTIASSVTSIVNDLSSVIPFPPLRAITKVLLGLFTSLDGVGTNKDAFSRVVKRAARIILDINSRLIATLPNAHDSKTFSDIGSDLLPLRLDIQQLQETLNYVAECVKEYEDSGWIVMLLRQASIKDEVIRLTNLLDDAVESFTINSLYDIHSVTASTLRRMDETHKLMDILEARPQPPSTDEFGYRIVRSDDYILREPIPMTTGFFKNTFYAEGPDGKRRYVKTYPRERDIARQSFMHDVAELRKYAHANIPQLYGVPAPDSDVLFLVLNNARCLSFWHVYNLLYPDFTRCVFLLGSYYRDFVSAYTWIYKRGTFSEEDAAFLMDGLFNLSDVVLDENGNFIIGSTITRDGDDKTYQPTELQARLTLANLGADLNSPFSTSSTSFEVRLLRNTEYMIQDSIFPDEFRLHRTLIQKESSLGQLSLLSLRKRFWNHGCNKIYTCSIQSHECVAGAVCCIMPSQDPGEGSQLICVKYMPQVLGNLRIVSESTSCRGRFDTSVDEYLERPFGRVRRITFVNAQHVEFEFCAEGRHANPWDNGVEWSQHLLRVAPGISWDYDIPPQDLWLVVGSEGCRTSCSFIRRPPTPMSPGQSPPDVYLFAQTYLTKLEWYWSFDPEPSAVPRGDLNGPDIHFIGVTNEPREVTYIQLDEEDFVDQPYAFIADTA